MSERFGAARRYFLPNVATNILALAVASIVEIYLTRYLIGRFGVSVYSLVPLAASIVGYAGLISLTLSGSLGRFVSLSLDRGDERQGSIYFTSGFFGILLLGLTLLVVTFLLLPFLGRVFAIPAGYEGDFSLLLLSVILASILGTLSTPFLVSTFVRHRFYLQNLTSTASKLLKIVVIASGFALFGPNLAAVGTGYLAMALFTLVGMIWISSVLAPELRIRREYFDWKSLREMSSMGGWIVVDQIGTLLYLNTDLIIINLLLGPEQAGFYAPILQIVLFMQMLAPALSGVFAPVAIDYIANDRLESLSFQTQRAIKFLGLALALPVGVACGFSGILLEGWLGPAFRPMSPILWLLLGPQVVFLAINPLYNINRGMNKVRVPALVTLAGGLLNLVLSVYFVQALGLGLYGVALATLIAFGCRTVLFTPIYTSRCLGNRWHRFITPCLPGLVSALIAFLICSFLSSRPDLGLLEVVAGAGLVSVVLSAVSFICLKKDEKALIRSILGRKPVEGKVS